MYLGYALALPVPNCPECGRGMRNTLPVESALAIVTCENAECNLRYAPMLVEKKTMRVLMTSGWVMLNGKPAWPSHWVNREGEQVLPQVIGQVRP